MTTLQIALSDSQKKAIKNEQTNMVVGLAIGALALVHLVSSEEKNLMTYALYGIGGYSTGKLLSSAIFPVRVKDIINYNVNPVNNLYL